MPDPQRVLVTGGAGFIGANLLRLLTAEGLRLTVVDTLRTGRKEYLDGLEFDFVDCDIRSPALAEVVDGHDAIVHLAAQSGVPASVEDPRTDCDLNVLGTLNVLEAARATGVGRLVFSSSNAPLGRQTPPATEDKAPLPVSPYGASKLAAEAYCQAYYGSFGVGTVVLRFGNVYGPFSAHKTSVVAKFFKEILAGRELVVHGDGHQTRDFIYVGDLCRAVLLALRSDVGGEVFQIATGRPTSIVELVDQMRSVSRVDVATTLAPTRQGDVRHNYAAVDKARRLLGWEPSTDLTTGLEETWRWMRTVPREQLAGMTVAGE